MSFIINPFRFLSLNQYIIATGGTITRDGDYLIHTITGTDAFDVTQIGSGLNNSIEYLIVAGGGGGGNFNGYGGGGGAGGYLSGNFTPAVQSYAAIIGAAGSGTLSISTPGQNGSDSSIFGLTSVGGGGGSGGDPTPSGGSGGGGANNRVGGLGTVGQGYDGGDASPTVYSSGGGGGAAEVGYDGITFGVGGNGGNGLSNSISGVATYYGGGGGAGGSTGGTGGLGGGGDGGGTPTNASINTGGGGGGSNGGGSSNGGSGIIIVKYYSPENPFPANLLTNLISRWKLDGNSNDSIGSNNGTDSNITYSQAKINDGAGFDSATLSVIDNIGSVSSFSYIQNTMVFTINLFIEFDDYTAVPQYFMGNTPTSVQKGFFIGTDSVGRCFLAFVNGSGAVILSMSIVGLFNNDLAMITIVGNGTNVKIYKNGALFDTSVAIGTLSSGDSTNVLNFGMITTSPGSGRFTGKLDEILFYDTDLDAAEVLQLYNYYNS